MNGGTPMEPPDLRAARQRVAIAECQDFGHDLSIPTGTEESDVVCGRGCGWVFHVVLMTRKAP